VHSAKMTEECNDPLHNENSILPKKLPSFLTAFTHHTSSVYKIIWDSGTLCSLIAAFAFSVNSLLVKYLGERVPTTEIVLIRRYKFHL
jgi:hypothetical protein